MSLWRKLFPIRERAVFVNSPAGGMITHMQPFEGDIIIATRSGTLYQLRRDRVNEYISVSELITLREKY